MLKLDKIMVAFDLSEDAVKAFKYACDLAEQMESDLIIANVINQRDVKAVEWTHQVSEQISIEKFIEEQIQYRSAEIDALMKAKYCRIPKVSKIFEVGVPTQELLKVIEQEKPAVVIMGTKGRSNIAGTLFGSTAEKMFRRCPVPLLSVRDN